MKKLGFIVMLILLSSPVFAGNAEKSITGERAFLLYSALSVEPVMITGESGYVEDQKILEGLTCSFWGRFEDGEHVNGCSCLFEADLSMEEMGGIYLNISTEEDCNDFGARMVCMKSVGDMWFKMVVGATTSGDVHYYFSVLN